MNLSRRSALTAAALAGAVILAPAAPAVAAVYDGPVRAITTPTQAATEKHTETLALGILTGNAADGVAIPATPAGVDTTNPEVTGLTATYRAKAHTNGGISRDADGILYAHVSHQDGLVIANPTARWIQHTNPLNGGTYVLPPHSGHQEWVPTGAVGSYWKAKGGAAKLGVPTGAKTSRVAGVYVGAPTVWSQEFRTGSGTVSQIHYTAAKGSHLVDGQMLRLWGHGGFRGYGGATGDKVRNADGSYSQQFSQVKLTIKLVNGQWVRV